MAEEIERIYVIPLKKTGFKSSKAAPTAIKRVKNYLVRHMKVEEEKIWIDDSLNTALWAHGKFSMPTRIRVKAVKFDDGVVEAYLPELDFKKSRRELLREEREKKEPILRKEEDVVEGEGEVSGTQDYDIAPTADGDVKIKKKKSVKEKTTEKKEDKTPKKEKKEDDKKEKTEKKKDTKKSSPKTKAKKKTADDK
jgi:large subunit ribosomal protein L31e